MNQKLAKKLAAKVSMEAFEFANGWFVVHPKEGCAGTNCCIHNPSMHAMIEEPMLYRTDRGLVERICSHGIGHPDPDSALWLKTITKQDQDIHGCDGCCSKLDRYGDINGYKS